MIVIDASTLVTALMREPGAERALARLVSDEERVAPDWIRLELASALTKKVLRGELSAGAALERIRVAPSFLTRQIDALDLIDDAVTLSLRLEHAVYDCMYLTLAERFGCRLVTADKEFATAARAAGYVQTDLI